MPKDPIKAMAQMINTYPAAGLATQEQRVRAGLNLSLVATDAADHALLCEALGVPAVVSALASFQPEERAA